MRDETVIAWITHGGIQESVDDQGAGSLVHLIFDRLAAHRNLHHHVDFIGWIAANRYCFQTHAISYVDTRGEPASYQQPASLVAAELASAARARDPRGPASAPSPGGTRY